MIGGRFAEGQGGRDTISSCPGRLRRAYKCRSKSKNQFQPEADGPEDTECGAERHGLTARTARCATLGFARRQSAAGPIFPTCYGPEFVATAVRDWIAGVGARTAYMEPGSPWENGYCESFNSRLRDELLDGEIFYSLAEAKIVIESWRRHYNTKRPHSSVSATPSPSCRL